MKRGQYCLGVALFAMGWGGAAVAEVRLPAVFSDNMMLQRDQPIQVWGWADPGEGVSVALAGKTATAKTDAKGAWAIELPALHQGENLDLSVTGKNIIVLKNVILGDIWLCAGSFNYPGNSGGMKLNDCAPADVSAANNPRIRSCSLGTGSSIYPEQDSPAPAVETQTDAVGAPRWRLNPEVPVRAAWQVCAPKTAGAFLAAGFYFAREISEKTSVPIGILDDTCSLPNIDGWVAPEGIAAVPELASEFAAKNREMNVFRAAVTNYIAQLPNMYAIMDGWLAAEKTAREKGTHLPRVPIWPTPPVLGNGVSGWCIAYNAMIHPLVRFPIKGVLWCHGEGSSTWETEMYAHKMRALALGWRKIWKQGDLATGSGRDFPFYFVQLAGRHEVSENPAGGDGWSKTRDLQLRALSIPNSGMAVTVDLVSPVEALKALAPKNKYDIGLRLARLALNRDYGQKDLVPSGPIFKSMQIEGSKARLMFDYIGSGLMLGTKDGRTPAVENKTGKLKRFAVAGADKRWVWADAVIDGNFVVVSSPAVRDPVAVRYAYSGCPDGANLYNREGLPASPFRTDAW